MLGQKDVYHIFTPLFPNTSTRVILKKPKTDSSIRKVWLPKTLAYILREWKKSQDELRGFLGDEYQDFDLVVALPNGCLLYTSCSVLLRLYYMNLAKSGRP